MQKFPLRNQCKPNNNKAFGSSDTHIQIKGREREQQGRDCNSCSPHKMPPPAPATATAFAPQRTQQRIYQPIASDATSLEKRQLSMEKPAVKVCSRVFTKEGADAENVATWNDVLSRSSFCSIRKDYSKHKLKQDQKQKQHQSKSLLSSSGVSFALGKDKDVEVKKVVVVDSDIAPAERKEPSVQRITSASAGEGTKLEVPCNGTVSSSSSNKNTNKNNNSDTNGNRNKDDHDDDDNNRRRRSRLELKLGLEQNQHQHQNQNHQSKTQAEAAIMSAAASAPEFITSERLRLGDQINFLLFDPYRTLKFLITELKSRLKTVVPDDINVQKILVEIQQTIKRVRIPNNATEPVLQQQPAAKAIRTTTLKEAAEAASKTTTTSTTATAAMVAINTEELQLPMAIATSKTPTEKAEEEAEAILTAEAVKYILPKERCHVIKNDDPLRNDARKVNSSCQTIIASQLLLENENVDACQMCEHYQVNHQSTLGCNQSRINENENGIAPNNDGGGDGGGGKSSMEKEKIHSIGAYHHQHQIHNQNQHQERSKDHRKDTEVQESFSCKSLQDTIEILKIKNNPFSRDTQRIIAQLETELSNFQRELQRTSSSSCFLSAPSDGRPHGESTDGGGGGSVQENSKVQSKRGLSLMLDKKQEENPDEQRGNEEEPTLQDFIADKLEVKFSKHCNRRNSSSTRDRATASISKESQTNLRSPTQMFCHLEKEKLLLIQKFRTSEMQTIQGDLNELHVFIKDQLNGIYRSITRENYQNLKYFSNDQSETWSWSQSRSQSQSRRSAPSDIKNKQKSRQRDFLTLQHDKKQQPEKIQAKGLSSPPPLALPLSSSPTASLTAPTSSSVLSSSQQMHEGGISLPLLLPTESKKKTTEELRSIWPRHYKKSSSSSSSSPSPDDNGNANNTKSMMKQKQAAAVAAAASSSSSFKLSTASAESEAVTDAKERHHHHHHNHCHHNISDVNVKVDKLDKADKAVCGKKSKYSHNLQVYAHHQEHLFANCRDAHCRFRDTPFCSDNHDDGGRKYHFSNVVDCRCQRWRLRGSPPSQPCSQPTQINDKVQRMMGARSTRPSTTTKSDINSTKKTSRLCPCPCSYLCPGQDSGPAVMTHNQRHHHHQHLSTTTTTTTGIAQDRIQLISSSLPAPTSVETAGAKAAAVMIAAPSYISTRPTDEDSRKTDAVTNAAVRAIIKDAYATTVTTSTDDAAAATIVATNTATAAKAAGHSNGIREPSHHQTHNSWQRVNLKNPTGCQMKKQICGPDGYECTIKNTNNNNDNRSNYPEIHDCQKCRANSINPFCGGLDLDLGLSLSSDSAKMHVVGAGAGANAAADVDNGATAFGVATACDDFDYKCDDDVDVNDDEDRGNDRDDFGAGGDGPINWKGEHKSLADGKENFTCHPEKRQRQKQNQNQKQKKRQQQWREQTTPRLLHCCVAQSALAFQTDLDDFKEFLDEIILSTPTTD